MVTKKADLSMKSGPEVPEGAHRPLIADKPHFRLLSDNGGGQTSMVLYLTGDHIPAGHADLPVVPAEFPVVTGSWVPRYDNLDAWIPQDPVTKELLR